MCCIVELVDGVESEANFFCIGLNVCESLVVGNEGAEFVVGSSVGFVAEICRTLDDSGGVLFDGILGVEYLNDEFATCKVELLELFLLHSEEGVEIGGVVTADACTLKV